MLKTSEADYTSKKFALTAKLDQCWTGPYQILFVGPGTTSSNEKIGPNLILIEVRKDEPGREINARVSVYRCKSVSIPMKEREDRNFCHGQ